MSLSESSDSFASDSSSSYSSSSSSSSSAAAAAASPRPEASGAAEAPAAGSVNRTIAGMRKRQRRSTTEGNMRQRRFSRSLSGSCSDFGSGSSSGEDGKGGRGTGVAAKMIKSMSKAVGRECAAAAKESAACESVRDEIRTWLGSSSASGLESFLPISALESIARLYGKRGMVASATQLTGNGLTDAFAALAAALKKLQPEAKGAEKALAALVKVEAGLEKARVKKNWADKQRETLADLHAAQATAKAAVDARDDAFENVLTSVAIDFASAAHAHAIAAAHAHTAAFVASLALARELESFLELADTLVYEPPAWYVPAGANNQLTELQSRVGGLTTDVVAAEAKVEALEAELATARARIAELEAAAEAHVERAADAAAAAAVGDAASDEASTPRSQMAVAMAAPAAETYEPGLHVLVVDAMQLVPVPEADHGFFCEGDSYVVVSVAESRAARVFFWIGSTSSRAEVTCACFSAMALSRQLKCAAQREEQDAESRAFRGLFWQGVNVVAGEGASSTLRSIAVRHVARMYRVVASGRSTRLIRLPLALDSLVHGTVTLVDTGAAVYQFEGRGCSMVVRGAALEFTSTVKQAERSGIVLHFAKADDSASVAALLAAIAPLCDDDAPSFADGPAAASFVDALPMLTTAQHEEAYAAAAPVVYQVTQDEASGKLSLTELEPPYSRAVLDASDAFVVDGPTELFAWIGSGSTPAEKAAAMEVAALFLAEHTEHRAAEWGVTRVVEGAETFLFRANFESWPAPAPTAAVGALAPAPSSDPDDPPAATLDVDAVLAGSQLRSRLPAAYDIDDDGSGIVNVMVMEDVDLVYSLPDEYLGHFFAGSGFAVIYSYVERAAESVADEGGAEKRKYIIYFWVGADADHTLNTAYELSLKGLLAVRFSESGLAPKFLRVDQGSESPHFRAIFRDRIVVHAGAAKASIPIPPANIVAVSPGSVVVDPDALAAGIPYNSDVLKARAAHIATDVSMYAFAPLGAAADAMTAVEVEVSAASLSSAGVYMVRTSACNYLWIGLGVPDVLYESAWELALEVEAVREAEAVAIVPAGLRKSASGSIPPPPQRSGSSRSLTADDDANESGSTCGDGGGKDLVIVEEKDEPPAFWEALGGKAPYTTSDVLRDPTRSQRLFVGGFAAGAFTVVEYAPVFVAGDLADAKVAILLVPPIVYVWTAATDVPPPLATAARDLAERMAAASTDALEVKTVVQGSEAAHFTAHFFGWHATERAAFVDPRAARVREMKARAASQRRALRDHMRSGACLGAFTGDVHVDAVRLNVYVCVDCGREVCLNCAKSCHADHNLSAAGRVLVGTWKGCGCRCVGTTSAGELGSAATSEHDSDGAS